MLVLFLLERRDGLFESRARLGVGGGMLAQHVRIAAETAPARDDLLERL